MSVTVTAARPSPVVIDGGSPMYVAAGGLPSGGEEGDVLVRDDSGTAAEWEPVKTVVERGGENMDLPDFTLWFNNALI